MSKPKSPSWSRRCAYCHGYSVELADNGVCDICQNHVEPEAVMIARAINGVTRELRETKQIQRELVQATLKLVQRVEEQTAEMVDPMQWRTGGPPRRQKR